MRIRKLICVSLLLIFSSGQVSANTQAQLEADKAAVVNALRVAGVHPGDLALIEAHLNDLSVEELTEIQRIMTDTTAIADSRWFDVSGYGSWDEYNFYRPAGDTLLGILARRDLFLDAARQLNNQALTVRLAAAGTRLCGVYRKDACREGNCRGMGGSDGKFM